MSDPLPQQPAPGLFVEVKEGGKRGGPFFFLLKISWEERRSSSSFQGFAEARGWSTQDTAGGLETGEGGSTQRGESGRHSQAGKERPFPPARHPPGLLRSQGPLSYKGGPKNGTRAAVSPQQLPKPMSPSSHLFSKRKLNQNRQSPSLSGSVETSTLPTGGQAMSPWGTTSVVSVTSYSSCSRDI